MDIAVQYTNARINRMSRRRQKIAMTKRSTMTFTNVHPVAVDVGTPVQTAVITLEVSFKSR